MAYRRNLRNCNSTISLRIYGFAIYGWKNVYVPTIASKWYLSISYDVIPPPFVPLFTLQSTITERENSKMKSFLLYIFRIYFTVTAQCYNYSCFCKRFKSSPKATSKFAKNNLLKHIQKTLFRIYVYIQTSLKQKCYFLRHEKKNIFRMVYFAITVIIFRAIFIGIHIY
jgi:hypothetical protein